ncbi:ElaB/YqjD/DUF883 family membrane-anchored ribosome-binding protein [Streptosporangium becharense]|uniref:ElaB/YqjD/DUF883 family membrane-anchored ribosome-binding protein n=1 Tax=Streptosporangium becharense TaxID=1816182 RepID=A0A7W9MGP1_9ACTN|nr:hypothetical protein [Streptosporangium becharense]MBB2909265.1 ElaB/YqjD/DUF883 family membrane-anchored ribosome-binding protein [Streptosporangium becharense]MBB5819716.1 ElaB/YqjD/DUF883 family membrane-anchored ribosome-binding protein [Streptosporangium becharense]
MPITTEVKKLADSKPFYAVAGAGDFAVEKLRELPEQLQRLQSRRGELGEVAKELPVKARELAGKAEGYAREFPEKARDYADLVAVRAVEIYEEFATRGRKVVSKASGEAALELEEVSEAAEPAAAAPAPKKTTRAPKSSAAENDTAGA